MAQTRIYRCWYKDDSARLVSQTGHREAAEEAQELAHLANAPVPPKEHEDYQRYFSACRVVKTECLSDGTVTKWKP